MLCAIALLVQFETARKMACEGGRGRSLSGSRSLCVMRPHSDDFYDAFSREHLIYETMLDSNPARVGSGEIADQLLVSWRGLERISFENSEEFYGFRF